MIDKKIFFVSSLPRSGSTLLMNILGQNPKHYVTPTSGMIELFIGMKKSWRNFIEFKAEGLEVVQPRIENAMEGMLYGYFKKEFEEGKIVFDKSRGWTQYIEILEKILGKKVKIIVTVRDVRAIVASFEKIYRNRGIDYIDHDGPEYFKCQTVYGRVDELLSKGGVVGLTISRLRDAFGRGLSDRLIIVKYRDLMINPIKTIYDLCDKLEIERFEFDPNNIKQVTHENDVWHGMKLHTIKNKIEPPENNPWEKYLPKDLSEKIKIDYQDIINLSN